MRADAHTCSCTHTMQVDIDVQIGAESSPVPTRMAVNDLPGFVSMGIADKPVMLIGADILKQRKGLVLSTYDRKFWMPAQ